MKISTKTSLILLGLGALAIYKYNKMTDEEKIALKEKGKKIFDEHINPLISNALGLVDEDAAIEQKASVK